ncbi:hypothetical protein IAU59_001774 [Kwoniella sp. CBS 9459]
MSTRNHSRGTDREETAGSLQLQLQRQRQERATGARRFEINNCVQKTKPLSHEAATSRREALQKKLLETLGSQPHNQEDSLNTHQRTRESRIALLTGTSLPSRHAAEASSAASTGSGASSGPHPPESAWPVDDSSRHGSDTAADEMQSESAHPYYDANRHTTVGTTLSDQMTATSSHAGSLGQSQSPSDAPTDVTSTDRREATNDPSAVSSSPLRDSLCIDPRSLSKQV